MKVKIFRITTDEVYDPNSFSEIRPVFHSGTPWHEITAEEWSNLCSYIRDLNNSISYGQPKYVVIQELEDKDCALVFEEVKKKAEAAALKKKAQEKKNAESAAKRAATAQKNKEKREKKLLQELEAKYKKDKKKSIPDKIQSADEVRNQRGYIGGELWGLDSPQ
jgi:hypothetical protein